MHLLTDNQVFVAGMWNGTSRVRHNTFPTVQNLVGDWLEPWQGPYGNGAYRHYGSSVLLPNVGRTIAGDDMVMILGGGNGANNSAYDTSRVIDGAAATPVWGGTEVMQRRRMCANAVLLPNGDVLAVGGCSDAYFQFSPPNPTPVFDLEYYRKGQGWQLAAAQQSQRMYHSTAVLLPSGRIVSAGGDIRTSDYEVYTPTYVQANRPSFAGTWAASGYLQLQWDTIYPIEHDQLPVGVTISRVVMMRPCSVTHHSDMDQRYVELERVKIPPPAPLNTVLMRTPSPPTAGMARGSTEAPRGYYMVFLVDSAGLVSAAKWVHLP
jgi:hypothetical protein